MNLNDFIVGKARPDEPKVSQPKYAGVIPKLHFRLLLTGPSKSGKSNLGRWLLDKYYVSPKDPNESFFDEIYHLSPTTYLDWMWVGLKGLKHENRIPNPDPSDLEEIMSDQIKEITGKSIDTSELDEQELKHLFKNKEKAPKVLIIFDDAIAESSLLSSKEFFKVFIQGRHFGISLMIMSQSYMQIPRKCRIQSTHVAMFPSKLSEIERLYTDLGPKEMSKREFSSMVADITNPTKENKFPFFYVDVFAPINKRFRKGLVEQIIVKDDGNDTADSEDYDTVKISKDIKMDDLDKGRIRRRRRKRMKRKKRSAYRVRKNR